MHPPRAHSGWAESTAERIRLEINYYRVSAHGLGGPRAQIRNDKTHIVFESRNRLPTNNPRPDRTSIRHIISPRFQDSYDLKSLVDTIDKSIDHNT